MPLLAQIADADTNEPRTLRWGWWHIVCMTEAARAHVPEVKEQAILEVWSHPSLRNGMTVEFPMAFRDPSDGEVLTLNRGDRLTVWRNS